MAGGVYPRRDHESILARGTQNGHAGAGYGIRIPYDDRDRHFPRNRGSVEVVFDDDVVVLY